MLRGFNDIVGSGVLADLVIELWLDPLLMESHILLIEFYLHSSFSFSSSSSSIL